MGGGIMKLVSLTVTKLYGCFNYDVKFNSDVTFIYGKNGCGKTTVLNIIGDIITGQLFKLFTYDFDKIELCYAKSENLKQIRKITITHTDNHLEIKFNGKIEKLRNLDEYSKNIRTREIERNEMYHLYFKRYDFLYKIKQTFNYVYLPLNRTNVSSEDYCFPLKMRKLDYYDLEKYGSFFYDEAMVHLEEIVSRHYAKINAEIVTYNDEFRNQILKSFIKVHEAYSSEAFAKDIFSLSVMNLQETKKDYIKILKELSLINEQEEEECNKFFDDFIEEWPEIIRKKGKDPLNLVTYFQEFSRIKNVVQMAEEMKKKKAAVRKPILVQKGVCILKLNIRAIKLL